MPHRVRRFLVAATLAVAAPLTLVAQVTPAKGTFGAEVTSSSFDLLVPSASLLWMATPNVALVTSFTANTRDDFSSIGASVGLRRFVPRPGKLRPIIGGGVAVTNNTLDAPPNFSRRDTQFGVYGEFGAAWFFTPNLMLGSTGVVSVSGGDGGTSLAARLVRLHAGVFF